MSQHGIVSRDLLEAPSCCKIHDTGIHIAKQGTRASARRSRHTEYEILQYSCLSCQRERRSSVRAMTKCRPMVLQLLIAAAGTLMKLAQGQAPLDPSRLLNRAPFVFAHNAATGYLQVPSDFTGALEGYAKNQEGNFTELLNCGARALDLEFILNADQVVAFGHGDVQIDGISIEDGIQEINDWVMNVAPDELILLSVDACDGCADAVNATLDGLGIQFITSCSLLKGFTVGDALELGPIVAIDKNCFVQNYNETLSCHGFLPSSDPANVESVRQCIPDLGAIINANTTTLITLLTQVFSCLNSTLTLDLVDVYDCWATSDSNEYPWNQVLHYLNTTARSGPPTSGLLWQLQGLWQANEDSILLGLFRPIPLPTSLLQLLPSSILQDVEASEVNRLVLEFVTELVGENVPLNLVEVDHVCDEYGSQLLPALRSTGGATSPPPTSATNPTTASSPTTVVIPSSTSPPNKTPSTSSPNTPVPTTSPPTTPEQLTAELTSSGLHLKIKMTSSFFTAVVCAAIFLV